ncbi:uncharacterized protein [Watersipora subatra]|uniref:uncharacterized protein n=1 Tax=Watersipora subatra TaxID=2589382 RepID=UPI00355C0077
MAMRCCHPILFWMFNFFLIIITTILAGVLLFTTFSARLASMTKEENRKLNLTVSEVCTVLHVAFTLCTLIFLHTSMKILSTGSHRDSFYRIDKDFKILCVLMAVSAGVVTIVGIVLYARKDSMLTFGNDQGGAGLAASKLTEELIRARTKVEIYSLYLLIADIASVSLTVLGVLTVLGCNRREKYCVEAAMQEAMLRSRSRSMSRSTTRSRDYRPRQYSFSSGV